MKTLFFAVYFNTIFLAGPVFAGEQLFGWQFQTNPTTCQDETWPWFNTDPFTKYVRQITLWQGLVNPNKRAVMGVSVFTDDPPLRFPVATFDEERFANPGAQPQRVFNYGDNFIAVPSGGRLWVQWRCEPLQNNTKTRVVVNAVYSKNP